MEERGIRKEKARDYTAKPRLPITPPILLQVKALWSPHDIDYDKVMLWAACYIMCFFGFFQLGEITSSSESSFDPQSDLSLADISVDNHTNPSYIQVFLKVSKTDQFRKGVSITLGKTDDELCPVASVLSYIALRGNSQGPFFIFKDRRHLTKQNFIKNLRSSLSALGFNSEHYAGHSFRIGAATTAAKAHIEDSLIRTIGRWKSDAFLSYIRTSRTFLAHISKVLATVR